MPLVFGPFLFLLQQTLTLLYILYVMSAYGNYSTSYVAQDANFSKNKPTTAKKACIDGTIDETNKNIETDAQRFGQVSRPNATQTYTQLKPIKAHIKRCIRLHFKWPQKRT